MCESIKFVGCEWCVGSACGLGLCSISALGKRLNVMNDKANVL